MCDDRRFWRGHTQEGDMRHQFWIYRLATLAALLMAAGAGTKWGR